MKCELKIFPTYRQGYQSLKAIIDHKNIYASSKLRVNTSMKTNIKILLENESVTLPALLAPVPYVLFALSVIVPHVSRVLSTLMYPLPYALHPLVSHITHFVPYVFLCLTSHVFSCLTYLLPYMPSCLTRFLFQCPCASLCYTFFHDSRAQCFTYSLALLVTYPRCFRAL